MRIIGLCNHTQFIRDLKSFEKYYIFLVFQLRLKFLNFLIKSRVRFIQIPCFIAESNKAWRGGQSPRAHEKQHLLLFHPESETSEPHGEELPDPS